MMKGFHANSFSFIIDINLIIIILFVMLFIGKIMNRFCYLGKSLWCYRYYINFDCIFTFNKILVELSILFRLKLFQTNHQYAQLLLIWFTFSLCPWNILFPCLYIYYILYLPDSVEYLIAIVDFQCFHIQFAPRTFPVWDFDVRIFA